MRDALLLSLLLEAGGIGCLQKKKKKRKVLTGFGQSILNGTKKEKI